MSFYLGHFYLKSLLPYKVKIYLDHETDIFSRAAIAPERKRDI